ncbi:DNA polymerase alpha subunit B [Histomonas meleagridis]|uniref:DNA polymerase alpha subunit B n=1 Tax=Histomonas meleagridis TaxID=135588 RepID=UPI00355AC9A6|nr:DNA polymerase alpha subunit B [Histomonas meleagridis]KAH0796668.1 DNA polymerase alpha subunit B [Histomonas meleagridis]
MYEISDVFDQQQHGRFFNHDIDSLQLELQNYVRNVGERIKKANNIEEEWTYDLERAEINNVLVYGRMYSGFQEDDPSEHFNLSNAQIHFTPDFNIPFLKFTLPNGVEPGLFRGQIIAAEGTINSDEFIPSKIYTDARPNKPNAFQEDLKTKLIVATGPYFTDNLETVAELNAKIKSYSPDFVIFLGPFVQPNNVLLMSPNCEYTAFELTQLVLDKLSEGIEDSVFIPSTEDALALPVIPHPKFAQYNGRANVFGDPCFVTLMDQINVLATANDIPLSINQNYSGEGESRRINVARQIAYQNSACPAMSPNLQIQYISKLVPENPPNIILTGTHLFNLHECFDGTNVIYVSQYIKNNAIAVIDVNGNNITTRFTSEFNK